MITVTVLIEETSSKQYISHEHGLSLYIKTPKHNLLFDTGATPEFINNADKLGVDLKNVDIAVISHGHYDHTGGLKSFLDLNSKARVYVNEHFFGDYWSSDARYIGSDPSLKGSSQIQYIKDCCEIDDELLIFSANDKPRNYVMDSFGLLKRERGVLTPDDFLHEQYLLLKDEDGCVLISGCSHKGILNILDWCPAEPRAAIGGLHLMKVDINGRGLSFLNETAKGLMEHDTVFYTCHCTGSLQYSFLKEHMGDKINYIRSGDRFII